MGRWTLSSGSLTVSAVGPRAGPTATRLTQCEAPATSVTPLARVTAKSGTCHSSRWCRTRGRQVHDTTVGSTSSRQPTSRAACVLNSGRPMQRTVPREGEAGGLLPEAGQEVRIIVRADDGLRGDGHGYARPRADGTVRVNRSGAGVRERQRMYEKRATTAKRGGAPSEARVDVGAFNMMSNNWRT